MVLKKCYNIVYNFYNQYLSKVVCADEAKDAKFVWYKLKTPLEISVVEPHVESAGFNAAYIMFTVIIGLLFVVGTITCMEKTCNRNEKH